MTREDLKRKFIACINMNAHDGIDTIKLDQESVECMAEACLSAIEQSSCTICPNEPTEEMVKAASSELNGWDRRFDGASTISWNAYIAMLSSSPFKTQGEKEE